MNLDSNSKDIDNKSNFKSQLSSIHAYKSKERNKSSIHAYKSKERNKSTDNKLDYVPLEFLKEKKRRRILRFII